MEPENSDVTLLRPELFQIHAMEGIAVDGPEIPLLRDVRKAFVTRPELEDPIALIAWELLKNWKAPSPCSAEWQISDGLLLFCGKIVVPQNKDLRRQIMEQHHDTQVTGHASRFKTLELISRNYWWPYGTPQKYITTVGHSSLLSSPANCGVSLVSNLLPPPLTIRRPNTSTRSSNSLSVSSRAATRADLNKCPGAPIPGLSTHLTILFNLT
jgi:hypothetical protein